MVMENVIVYPAGSHGNFLGVALNTLVGIAADNVNQMVYDRATYQTPKQFFPVHFETQLDPGKYSNYNLISIIVKPSSYLKYSAICFNRVSGVNLKLEDFEKNTFEKLKTHVIYSHFKDSLVTIAGTDTGDVEKKCLREWARLCLFDNNGKAISMWIADNAVENADFEFDFEWFYDADILKSKCSELVEAVGLTVTNTLDHLLTDFYQNNLYRNIDRDTEIIIRAIKDRQPVDIVNTNFFQEAYIDQWLVDTYQINPLSRNKYFTSTIDLIKEYQL